jgi:hypothetical protein
MTKPTPLAFALLAAAVLGVGYGIVRACTSGAIAGACDHCIEPPDCSQTVYFSNCGLSDRAVGYTCETCSTYYQGCDSAGTNALGTNAVWAQFYQAVYCAASSTCSLASPEGPAVYVGPASTTYQTLESGCGELTGPAAGRPVQLPIFIKPPQ